jgi:3-oxoacyl-[acyl-carrier protein] reductase
MGLYDGRPHPELWGQKAEREGTTTVGAGWEAQIHAERLGTAQGFAAVAAFTCSKKASYVTGTFIWVYRGWNRSLF